MPPAAKKGKTGERVRKPSSKKASQAMSARGASTSTVNARADHLAKGNAFLAHVAEHDETKALTARWGLLWKELPEAEAAQCEVYEHAGNFLADVYTIPAGQKNAGQKLGSGTAVGIWRGLLNERRVHFSSPMSPATKVCACMPALHAPLPCPACSSPAGLTQAEIDLG